MERYSPNGIDKEAFTVIDDTVKTYRDGYRNLANAYGFLVTTFLPETSLDFSFKIKGEKGKYIAYGDVMLDDVVVPALMIIGDRLKEMGQMDYVTRVNKAVMKRWGTKAK